MIDMFYTSGGHLFVSNKNLGHNWMVENGQIFSVIQRSTIGSIF
jgi:hypothetical protein